MSSYESDLSSAAISHSQSGLPENVGLKRNIVANNGKRGANYAIDDARMLVRLLQCATCSLPLESPTILPCGNEICRKCIPECHDRQNISYPIVTNERRLGFTCPFVECGQEHVVGDCNVDVVFAKLMDIVRANISLFRGNTNQTSQCATDALDENTTIIEDSTKDSSQNGGRLVMLYTLAESGNLPYDAEILHSATADSSIDDPTQDLVVLNHLKEVTNTELDCQVCYGLFLDPLTTSCGHTFCRKCIRRVFDHSTACPICRRSLRMSPAVLQKEHPSNKRLLALLLGLCPDSVAAREQQVLEEEIHSESELSTPLFICGISFPSMPTFLHIFEPRYRLMIRRALDKDGCFGMLLHNPRQIVQGELGRVPFYQYGTLMKITSCEQLPDGRSLIETVGVSRFRVLRHGTLDAYLVGKVEKVDDMPLVEEEALEAAETSIASTPDSDAVDTSQSSQPKLTNAFDLSKLDNMSTQDLMSYCIDHVKRMREASAPWLKGAFYQSYGECPTDLALFPWWFASILPIVDMEKYKLMETRTVRARLKICAGWVMRIEAQKWSRSAGCAVI